MMRKDGCHTSRDKRQCGLPGGYQGITRATAGSTFVKKSHLVGIDVRGGRGELGRITKKTEQPEDTHNNKVVVPMEKGVYKDSFCPRQKGKRVPVDVGVHWRTFGQGLPTVNKLWGVPDRLDDYPHRVGANSSPTYD